MQLTACIAMSQKTAITKRSDLRFSSVWKAAGLVNYLTPLGFNLVQAEWHLTADSGNSQTFSEFQIQIHECVLLVHSQRNHGNGIRLYNNLEHCTFDLQGAKWSCSRKHWLQHASMHQLTDIPPNSFGHTIVLFDMWHPLEPPLAAFWSPAKHSSANVSNQMML